MQSHARVVVVGGGCVGVNILYSLAHRGWTDACLLERTELTCLLYTSPSPRDQRGSRMPSSA